ncbi:hypothetical protein Tcan_01712, partial [Toxocara canis]
MHKKQCTSFNGAQFLVGSTNWARNFVKGIDSNALITSNNFQKFNFNDFQIKTIRQTNSEQTDCRLQNLQSQPCKIAIFFKTHKSDMLNAILKLGEPLVKEFSAGAYELRSKLYDAQLVSFDDHAH